ncbi:MAG TPA: prepilin-type N-terminal cleavage/methylation domain-containing protein [Pirellulales bacterium]|nr:prepilin-type N-terminal cleavage/methylation domain-containing protein [Pirellulales bacterium]
MKRHIVDGFLSAALGSARDGRRCDKRSGISLLEVLISIGVLSVGLLGAVSLIPMATYMQSDTTKYDRGGALAQQVVHDLEIKNYLSPRRWIFIDPSNPNANAASSWFGIMQLANMSNFNFQSAFVIDPLGFSNVVQVAQQDPTGTIFPSYFPAFPSQLPNPPGQTGSPPPFVPTVYRAGITANDYWPAAATMPTAAPLPMSYSVADRMMRSSDDVLFEVPANTDLRPHTVSGTSMPNSAGEFSWIATVSRTPSDMAQTVPVANLHRFQVSVVVLQKRDLTLWSGGLTPEQPPSERQVFAMFTQYGGQAGQNPQILTPFAGGGSLQLYVYETTPLAAGQANRHWLENIKPNTYLMLSANFQDLVGAVVYPQLVWYRIVNVDDGPTQDPNFSGGPTNNTTRWYRNLTVTGADWPAMWFQWTTGSGTPISGAPSQFWFGADPNAPNALIPFNTGTANSPSQTPVAFCTLMDNAIAVYDDVMTLPQSLLNSP